MRSLLKSTVGLLLTVVLLAWSGVRTSGWLTQCAGDGDGACEVGLFHAHVDDGCSHAELESVPAFAEQREMFQAPGCGCPPSHVHLDAFPPLLGAAGLNLSLNPVILVPFSAWPMSRAEWDAPLRTVAAAIAFAPVPPGPPPMHLADAPMLI